MKLSVATALFLMTQAVYAAPTPVMTCACPSPSILPPLPSPSPSPNPSPKASPSPVVSPKPSPSPITAIGPKLPVTVKSGTSVTLANQRIAQDWKGIAVQTELVKNSNGSVKMDNISASKGTLFWGHGGTRVEIHNSWSDGISTDHWKYILVNFDNPLAMLIWDNSGIDKTMYQGPYEAAVRLMQVGEAHLTNIKLKGSHNPDGSFIKQVLQDRSGGKHYFKNVYIDGQADIGYMTDPAIPLQPLELSSWENCTMTQGYHRTPGVKRITMKNVMLKGVLTSFDNCYSYPSGAPMTCPK